MALVCDSRKGWYQEMARVAARRVKAQAPAITAADQSIGERLPQLVESLLNLAVGISVEKEPGSHVYTLPPNRLAAEYLINRVLGKPAERMPHSDAHAATDDLNRELKNLRNLTTDELIQLHRKTIGED